MWYIPIGEEIQGRETQRQLCSDKGRTEKEDSRKNKIYCMYIFVINKHKFLNFLTLVADIISDLYNILNIKIVFYGTHWFTF